jgi:CRISPR/Cas system-associated exonuclease Cas4 (RecB family)
MNRFLDTLAAHLYEKYGEALSRLWIVFPNRRAALFFRHYLAKKIHAPVWTPALLTINDLMHRLCALYAADSFMLNVELYQVYKKHRKSAESFDEFYPWGELLLADFNDIDKYLIVANDLFRNLQSVKEIDYTIEYLDEEQKEAIHWFWKSFRQENLSVHQQEFISLWSVLGPIYHEFRENLSSRGLAYEGMIYRQVAEQVSNGNDLSIPAEKVVLVGFNALSTSEHAVFSHLNRSGKAEFYWDYDPLFVDDKNHEAGYFIRGNLKRYPATDDIQGESIPGSGGKQVTLLAASSQVAQAHMVGDLLNSQEDDRSEAPDCTCVILPDETLLLPVLYSLPEKQRAVNISMGYPLKDTPAFSLLEIIFDLLINARREKNGALSYLSFDLLRLLSHPFIHEEGGEDASHWRDLIDGSGSLYIPFDLLEHNPFLASLLPGRRPEGSLASMIQDLLYRLFLRFSMEPSGIHSLQREFLYKTYLVIERIGSVLQEKGMHLKADTWLKLLRKYMGAERLSFEGEPLEGLQVLGILETRLLDFENVIILSMNEGVWPKANSTPSFIPYNLRRGFGLPTPEHQDSIYSYYFYRLVQRAKKVWMLYNSQEGGLISGEKSRYITQMETGNDLYIDKKVLAFNVFKTPAVPVEIKKTDEVLQLLDRYKTDHPDNISLSPSAINTYIYCPLKFYFGYLAKIEEDKELSTEINPADFGTMLHHVMLTLYAPYRQMTVTREILEEVSRDEKGIGDAVRCAMAALFAIHDLPGHVFVPDGQQLIVEEILRKYVHGIIRHDLTLTPFQIHGLEETCHTTLPVSTPRGQIKIVIGGKIDRIDQTNEGIRIIDYKTGRQKEKIDSITSLFTHHSKDRNEAALQTMLYAWIWKNNHDDRRAIIPQVYYIRDIYNRNFDSHLLFGIEKTPIMGTEEFENILVQELEQMVARLLDPALPFFQTTESKNCSFCAYRLICHREDANG